MSFGNQHRSRWGYIEMTIGISLLIRRNINTVDLKVDLKIIKKSFTGHFDKILKNKKNNFLKKFSKFFYKKIN